MKIARVKLDGNETYGFVRDGSISVRDEMIENTGIPLPPEIKQFLFDGWFEDDAEKSKAPICIKDHRCKTSCSDSKSSKDNLSCIQLC